MAMKRLLSLTALSLFAGIASAQVAPAWEVSGGYQFVRGFDPCCSSANGFSTAVQENKNSWFGGVFDLGASFQTNGPVRQQLFTFMFGPQVTYRKSSSLQPFARAVIGGARYSITNGANDTNLAFGGGVGVDVHMTSKVYFRVNADFVRTAFFGQVQKYAQTGAGIVYRIGSTEK
jgi:hypothetical protein